MGCHAQRPSAPSLGVLQKLFQACAALPDRALHRALATERAVEWRLHHARRWAMGAHLVGLEPRVERARRLVSGRALAARMRGAGGGLWQYRPAPVRRR